MLRVCYLKSDGLPSLVFEGEISIEQLEYAVQVVISGPEFPAGAGMVADVTRIEGEPTADQIRELASFFGSRKEELGHRIALVVSSKKPVQYGLARMLSAYADNRGLTVGVFTDFEEACGWLNRAHVG
jgi:hypothetical protein